MKAAPRECERFSSALRFPPHDRPGQNFLISGKMTEWFRIQVDAKRSRHGVDPQFRDGGLERPGRMLDFAVDNLPRMQRRAKAISFGEPVIQTAGRGVIDRSGWTIRCAKFCGRCLAVNSFASLKHGLSVCLRRHARVEVGEAKPARGSHRKPARRVQAEKPHTASPARLYVGSNIQLGKPHGRRHIMRAHAAHVKRHYGDPAPVVEEIQLQFMRDQRAERLGANRPV